MWYEPTPTIWSHDGLITVINSTPQIRAELAKLPNAAAYIKEDTFDIPTRRALAVLADTYKVAIDDGVDKDRLKPEQIEAKYAEVVPVAEWEAARALVAASEDKTEKPLPVADRRAG